MEGTSKRMRIEIKELRARYDPYARRPVAKKVGVRRKTILLIEKGTYNPSLKLVHYIA